MTIRMPTWQARVAGWSFTTDEPPNLFYRKMQEVFFGVKWVKIIYPER